MFSNILLKFQECMPDWELHMITPTHAEIYLKPHRDPLLPYYKKIPKFYKDLGWKACWEYVVAKMHKAPTAHGVINYGDVKLVFWEQNRKKIMQRIEWLREVKGDGFSGGRIALECYTINKPWLSRERKYFEVRY